MPRFAPLRSLILPLTVLAALPGAARADDATAAQGWRIVQQYRGTWTAPPAGTPSGKTVDAPLLGNGDVGVAIGGNIDQQTFYVGKNEFWTLENGAGQLRAVGRVQLAVAGMTGASYAAEQDLATAEVRGKFTAGGRTIAVTSRVAAGENLLISELSNGGATPAAVTVTLDPGLANTYPTATGSKGAIIFRDVRADSTDAVGGFPTLQARLATAIVGATGAVSGAQLTFTIAPNAKATLVTAVLSNRDDADWKNAAVARVTAADAANLGTVTAAHRAWWQSFWSKSYVELDDKMVEKFWYGSLYIMGSASRAGEYPPGLWGPWIDQTMNWRGDFTLNTNYESPFYGPVIANHAELTDNYDKPIIDWMPNGQAYATANGYKGVYYRVHIGPMPNGSLDTKQWNQKFPAALAASPMIFRWQNTLDAAYAARIYPFLKQVAAFWQAYLSFDGKRYVILEDSQPEGSAYPQTNGVDSLGYVRYLLRGCIQISTALGMDSDLRTTWQGILDRLSPYPTFTHTNPFTMKDETVFRVTEVGDDWTPTNTQPIRHIYYGHAFGMEGDPTLLKIGLASVDQLRRWSSSNGMATFYPTAARVGYDPKEILTQLANLARTASHPNLHLLSAGGGLENVHIVPATVGEMMVQSLEGIVRPFSDWPATGHARFGDLRAFGAFLVSSEIDAGKVKYVRIVSEKGSALTFRNPWPVGAAVYVNGQSQGTKMGDKVALPTAAGDVLLAGPAGATYAALLAMVGGNPTTADDAGAPGDDAGDDAGGALADATAAAVDASADPADRAAAVDASATRSPVDGETGGTGGEDPGMGGAGGPPHAASSAGCTCALSRRDSPVPLWPLVLAIALCARVSRP